MLTMKNKGKRAGRISVVYQKPLFSELFDGKGDWKKAGNTSALNGVSAS